MCWLRCPSSRSPFQRPGGFEGEADEFAVVGDGAPVDDSLGGEEEEEEQEEGHAFWRFGAGWGEVGIMQYIWVEADGDFEGGDGVSVIHHHDQVLQVHCRFVHHLSYCVPNGNSPR